MYLVFIFHDPTIYTIANLIHERLYSLVRVCPIRGHIFKGNGWEGIDSHWRADHEDIMVYEDFWVSLCPKHRNRTIFICFFMT